LELSYHGNIPWPHPLRGGSRDGPEGFEQEGLRRGGIWREVVEITSGQEGESVSHQEKV
jgi:hypothetical protein